jgi:ubiquitin C-terminal hydrolase
MDYLLDNKDKDLNEENSMLYNLYGITVHVGQGNEYGHYYSIIKIANKWFKFDDEIISV